MSLPDFPIERSHCNECGHVTKHFVVAERNQPGSEFYEFDSWGAEGVEVSWRTTYKLLECCGCETVSVKRTHWFSEWDDREEVSYFPPRVSRKAPKWMEQLPDELQSLMTEVYAALEADSRRLAMMGARAAVDIVMQQKVGDIGGFAQKLSELVKQGFISERNKAVLAAALDVGNAAAHRGHEPSSEEVNQVIDIVENLLQADLLESAADNLRQRTPARSKDESKTKKNTNK